MHGGNLVDIIDGRLAGSQASYTFHDFLVGTFSHQQSTGLVGQPDGGTSENESDDVEILLQQVTDDLVLIDGLASRSRGGSCEPEKNQRE